MHGRGGCEREQDREADARSPDCPLRVLFIRFCLPTRPAFQTLVDIMARRAAAAARGIREQTLSHCAASCGETHEFLEAIDRG